jgi:hypothetical protein
MTQAKKAGLTGPGYQWLTGIAASTGIFKDGSGKIIPDSYEAAQYALGAVPSTPKTIPEYALLKTQWSAQTPDPFFYAINAGSEPFPADFSATCHDAAWLLFRSLHDVIENLKLDPVNTPQGRTALIQSMYKVQFNGATGKITIHIFGAAAV